jgi:HTH-type transcriptional regulator/antitoxin HigA
MEPRIIKTDEQYRSHLAEVRRLVADDPDPATPEGARLELLAKLVEDYERERFRFSKPDAIDAIVFRMEQQGLRQKDIALLLGGKNRASEILARKRPLTLPMIRTLHERLQIPSDLLIREAPAEYAVTEGIDDAQVPLDLLVKRGWIDARMAASDLLRRFQASSAGPVMLRHTLTFGNPGKVNRTHVWLWLSRVRELADSRTYLQGRYQAGDLNENLLRYVVRLSWMDKGPRLATDFLEERGIAVVIEPHLPKTHLDGAALLGRTGAPVIGLTLREDRLDHFWFTLLHELVHAWKHLEDGQRRAIVDEHVERRGDTDDLEAEANRLAGELLLPQSAWSGSDACLAPSAASIEALARELQISPAIVAGRVRYERRNYALFARLVGYRQARAAFPEVAWG